MAVLGLTMMLVAAVANGLGATQHPEHDDGDENEGRSAFAIGLWGDLPYSVLQACTGILTISGSTSHFRTLKDAGWRTSPASRRSETTRRTATTTCTG